MRSEDEPLPIKELERWVEDVIHVAALLGQDNRRSRELFLRHHK